MARPTTKDDLIQQGNKTYVQLIELIDSIPPEMRNNTFTFDISGKKEAHWVRDKNIRDVLVHLHEWHVLLLNWVENNQKGIEKPFLEEGYNWKTYGDMNVRFWEKHQNTSYETALSLFKESHIKVMKLAQTFSNTELFSKNAFSWVGGSTLGSYFVSATSSHYTWAIKKIKLAKKTL